MSETNVQPRSTQHSGTPPNEPGAPRDGGTRGRLIQAARELFIERGYAGVTVQEIARRAGYTTGALYGQFASKEELISEVIADAIGTQVRAQLDRAIPGRSPAEAAHVLLMDVVTRPVEPTDMLVMHGLAASRGEGREAVTDQLMKIVNTVRNLLERGRKDGVIDPEIDIEAMLQLTAALAFGSMALKMLDLPAPDPDALAEAVGRFELTLAPRPAGA